MNFRFITAVGMFIASCIIGFGLRQTVGAIFTVADFAFAVAVNAFAEQVTVSLQHGITFLAPARGKEIVAEARCVRSGRSTCFYTVTISDELGTAVAHMTVNGFVTQQKMR